MCNKIHLPLNSGIHPMVIQASGWFLISNGKLPKVALIEWELLPLNLPKRELLIKIYIK